MRHKQKILIFVLLSISLIILVGMFRFTPFTSELRANHFWLSKFENSSKYDVVVYGDSRTYRGLSPNVLLEDVELSGYNYGFTSAGYSNEIFELINSRIDKSKHPIIILGVTPYSLTLKASLNKFFFQEKRRKGFDKFKRLNFDHKMSFFDRIVVDEYFKPSDYHVFQDFHDDGWVASSKMLIDTMSGLKSYKTIFNDNQVSDSIVNLLMVNIAKWVESGIEVFAFRPPTIITMVELETAESGFNAASFITEFKKVGGRWIDVINGDYISYDASHLQKESAIELSRTVRKYIFDK